MTTRTNSQLPKSVNLLNLKFSSNSFMVMGILNITDDSFYDGGQYLNLPRALERVESMISEGADVIDIGAESSRPFAKPISPQLELERIQTVVQALRKISDIPISIDTVHSHVARVALNLGANLINDISALRRDREMVTVVREFNCPVILMHMRGTPLNMQLDTDYDDMVLEIQNFFKERIQFAIQSGIEPGNIIIDPGIGFGKSAQGNLVLLKNLDRLAPGYPILVGTSRKSFIGKILDVDMDERLVGTLATIPGAYSRGARFFRVHDVKETKQFLTMLRFIEEEKDINLVGKL